MLQVLSLLQAVCILAVGYFRVGQWHLYPNIWGLGEG